MRLSILDSLICPPHMSIWIGTRVIKKSSSKDTFQIVGSIVSGIGTGLIALG